MRESREILRVLKEFGPVVSFRNLNVSAQHLSRLEDELIVFQQLRDSTRNTVLAIYENPQSAASLVKASPLSFNFHPPAPRGTISGPGSFRLSQITTQDSAVSQKERNGTSTEGFVSDAVHYSAREFNLTADISLMDHQSHVERQPYFWGFSTASKTFAEEDLAKSVPLKGMSAFAKSAPELPLRIVKKYAEEARSRRTPRQLWNDT